MSENIEIKFGRISFISPDKTGAFVTELQNEEKELFVNKELLKGIRNIVTGSMVRIEKSGDKVLKIAPF